MKVVRLNENDIEKLIRSIIKEDNGWFDETVKYDLVGIYIRKDVQKLSGISSGGVVEVTEINGNEATYFISYNIKAVVSGYPYSSEGPYKMDVKDLVEEIIDGVLVKYEKPIQESRLFGGEPPKLSPDERIANYILEKMDKERPEVKFQFIDYKRGFNHMYNIKGNEAKLYRVNFSNNSEPITFNNSNILTGGDFGVVEVRNVYYQQDTGNGSLRGYAIKLTGDVDPLDIPESLAKKIYLKVKDHYGDIRVFKTKRLLDTGQDNADDIFNQLNP